MRILVAENDPALGTFLQRGLDAEQYSVDLTPDGEGAMSLAIEHEYDAAILDLNLPGPNALDVLQDIRARRAQLPILVLASRAKLEERVYLLDLGADDLVVKPFAFSELSARLRAVLRRGSRSPETILCAEDLELNRVEHTVKRAGRPIGLTPKEFSLLEYLMRNMGTHVTRAQIIEHVWNLDCDTMTNIVDVYINYLRKKVDAGSERKLIRTVRGVGYQLQTDQPSSDPAERLRAKACGGSL